MFDIASAFDKVWHQGLLFKLAKIETPLYLIELIADFLKDRTFSVKIDQFETAKYNISCGVPQGAVISPTLFSIFINDVPIRYDNKKGQYSLLYADDLVFMAKFGKSTKTVEKDANKYLNELEKWSNLWRLKFAPHKCSYTIFARTKRSAAVKLNLKMYNPRINEDKTPKFLGLIFDSQLSGKSHLVKIKKTCNSRLNIIRILTHKSWGLRKETLIQIYKSLIRSVIEYMGMNYYAFGRAQRNELEVIQNSALRAILKKKREDGNKNLLREANIESIRQRMNRLNCKYVEKSIKQGNPIVKDLIENYKGIIEKDTNSGYISGATILNQNKFCNRIIKEKLSRTSQTIRTAHLVCTSGD